MGMEWHFGQEITKQLTVQEGISFDWVIELQMARVMENGNLNGTLVLLLKMNKSDKNMLGWTFTVERTYQNFKRSVSSSFGRYGHINTWKQLV